MSKARIFVVEDERIVSLALQRTLGKLGYNVAGAEASGEAAVEAVGTSRPDLVLMDIQLDGELDGVAAAEQIRARHGLPVIYLTGYSDGETLGRAKVTEPSGYIIKPFEERELQIAIETALYKHATEARLKRVEHWLSTTLRSIADAVVATDAAGDVTFLNPVAEELTGWKSGEALGRPLEEVCRLLEPSPLPSATPGRSAQTPSPSLEPPVMRLVSRSGSEIAVERSVAPLRDEVGGEAKVAGSVLVFRDVTGRQQLEAQLRQAQRLESVGRLAAGVAHDFNNLLTIIQGHADAIGTSHEDRERAQEGISQAVAHAAQLTRQLLTFSRQQCVQLRAVEINGVVENIHGMIRRLLGATIAVRFQPGADLPLVQADPGMVEQTLMNLAVNARDAMPEGGVLLIRTTRVELDESEATTRSLATARPGTFVQLEVSDTGCGMDEATLRRACEPFYTTKPVGQGTGLGLSTVLGIVQQHGGWMELESKLGRGTICRVILPADASTETNATALAGPDAGPSAASQAGRGETILLVEDEHSLRDLVESMLKEAGYQVIAAASGVEALELWSSHAARIDLVLTDLVMPEGLSGRDLANRLRESRPDLKIIYSSGYSLDLTDPQFAGGQGFYFLEKPYRSKRLIALLRECLDAPAAMAPAAA